jgi:hypothetical protein
MANVALRSLHHKTQRDPLPPTVLYDAQRARNAVSNGQMDLLLDDAMIGAFQFRVKIAQFVRGFPLGAASLWIVLEFLIGPGPQVARFMRYRSPYVP